MFSMIGVLVLTYLAAAKGQASTVINQDNGGIKLNGAAGRKLIQNSRKAAQNTAYYYGNVNGQSQYDGDYQEIDWDSIDTSYLAGYSLKFQGCHHVQQWNEDAYDEADIKILTQRLVRFRLCPADTCSSTRTSGCTKNYGDYLVDLETYIEAYMDQMAEQYQMQNQYYQNRDNDRKLYNNYNNNRNNNNRNQNENYYNNKYNLNFEDYLECQEMDMNGYDRNRVRELRQRTLANSRYSSQYYQFNSNQDEDVQYYIGPYCADQGGEIRLGVFYENTCTVPAEEGEELFALVHNGMNLPYSKQSLVNLDCISCGGYGEVNELCESIYEVAGKCETKMDVYYPNESACTYLDGIKIIREDGVIRTSATRRSTAAAVTTGLFLTAAFVLSGYVYYLRTKLGRARINLAASQNP